MKNFNSLWTFAASTSGRLLIAIAFSHGVAWAAVAGNTDRPPRFVETARGVIFSDYVSREKKVCKLSSCWTPSLADVDALEGNLEEFLTNSKVRESGEILRNLSKYKRKYFGFKKNGTRFILVNGLCEKFWKKDGANFDSPNRPGTDMGNCYFLIDYDVKRGTFSGYYVDGD